MENRERDKVSRNSSTPTDAGEVNRNTSERMHKNRSDSSVDFGEKIGRSEGLNSESGRSSGSGSMGSSSSSSSGGNRGSSDDGRH
ncbi:MAG: hypothetical protein JWO97_4053 [Acidobacteria bacterium]|nr:hypothetical protein [Acidobacteriota bacterium]